MLESICLQILWIIVWSQLISTRIDTVIVKTFEAEEMVDCSLVMEPNKEITKDVLEAVIKDCKEVNKKLCTLDYLKKHALIKKYGTYRKLSKMAGTPIKTVHSAFQPCIGKIHKGTE